MLPTYSTLVERLDPASATTLLSFSGEMLTAPVFDTLDEAHDNIRIALRWWLDTRQASRRLVLLRALGPPWMWRGIAFDGRRWFEEVFDLAGSSRDEPGVGGPVHAHAVFFGGFIARKQGDYDTARALAEASVAMWRPLGDPGGLAQALVGSACTRWRWGNCSRPSPSSTKPTQLHRLPATPCPEPRRCGRSATCNAFGKSMSVRWHRSARRWRLARR